MSDNISINKPINSLNTNQPLDIRTLVNSYSDIANIPNPYIGMTITVKHDETNDNKMTDYKVKSLKSNELGMNNTLIDEIERLDVYVGIDEIKSQLDNIDKFIGNVVDGLDYKIDNNSIYIDGGKIFKNGSNINIENKSFNLTTNNSLKLKRDVICINNNNELCLINGELGSEPVYGYRVYNIENNASVGDRVIFQGELLSCVDSDTISGNTFKLGNTIEDTTISLMNALCKNDIISSFFNVYRNGTSLSLFEKIKGGGHTPDIIQNNGTLEPPLTTIEITCDEVVYSKQSMATKPTIPDGYIELFEIRTQNNKLEIIDNRLVYKQHFYSDGNVKNFGAIGDGITDDTNAIQKAIDNCNTVFFPKGDYFIKTGLKYTKNNLTMIGEHATLIGKSSEIGENYTPILTSPSYDECSSREIFENLTIKGLKFKRNRLFFNEPDKLLLLRYVKNVLIDNCSFVGWNGDAIGVDLLYNSNSEADETKVPNNITVKNCIFDGIDNNNSQAFYVMNGHDIKIEGNLFKNCTRKHMPGAINFENWENSSKVSIYNIIITNNTFENIRGDGGCINVYLKNPQSTYRKAFKNLIISNNIFSKCKGSFFTMINRGNYGLDDWESHNVKISNNIFNGTNDIYWISLRVSGVKSIDITNNTFNNLCGTAFFGDVISLELNNPLNIYFNFSNNIINDFRPYSKRAGAIFEVGINKGFICSNNRIMRYGSYNDYQHIYVFKYVPKTSSILQHQIFSNNSIYEFSSKTIYTFIQDVVNNNNSNIIKDNNMLSDGIKEHNITQE